MQIGSHEYQVFYRKLRTAFIDRELDGNIPNNKGNDSPAIWNERGKSGTTDQPAAEILFSGRNTTKYHYFYRLHINFNTENVKKGKIDDLALSKGLEYLGFAISDHLKSYKNLKPKDRAIDLFKQFEQKYKDEISAEKKAVEPITPLADPADPFLKSQLPDSSVTAAKLCIQRFYESIANSDLKTAWELMSPNLKSRRPWEGNFERFESGYTNTNMIRNILVFDFSSSVPNVIDCRVSYNDDVDAWTTKELSSFDSLTIDDIEEFLNSVKNLRTKFESKGLENFGRIELAKLFEPTASEYIWFTCNYDAAKLYDLFEGKQKRVTVKRLYDCSCRLHDDNWLINSISANRILSAR